jgi:hypothetical protein
LERKKNKKREEFGRRNERTIWNRREEKHNENNSVDRTKRIWKEERSTRMMILGTNRR